MLTYLIQMTEGLLLTAVLTGMLFAFAGTRWDKSSMRIVQAGFVTGWAAAIWGR